MVITLIIIQRIAVSAMTIERAATIRSLHVPRPLSLKQVERGSRKPRMSRDSRSAARKPCSLRVPEPAGREAGRCRLPASPHARIPYDDEPFSERELALAAWARTVARSPGHSTPQDIQRFRDAGFKEPQIVALSTFAALRTAFSSINSALGARPDIALTETLDPAVRAAVTWGRTPS